LEGFLFFSQLLGKPWRTLGRPPPTAPPQWNFRATRCLSWCITIQKTEAACMTCVILLPYCLSKTKENWKWFFLTKILGMTFFRVFFYFYLFFLIFCCAIATLVIIVMRNIVNFGWRRKVEIESSENFTQRNQQKCSSTLESIGQELYTTKTT
jgi:hypothetical protein